MHAENAELFSIESIEWTWIDVLDLDTSLELFNIKTLTHTCAREPNHIHSSN